MSLKKRLPRTVLVLGTVSLFTDISSEMIYPLLPVFLAGTLGAGAVALGTIEGLAETTSAFFKILSGIWTDRTGKRKAPILFGYGIAGVVRPFIGIAGSWPFVLVLRFLDRVGKGVRSSPRDALIADVTPLEQRGAAFGLHRSMDHAGAVIGPLIAGLLLEKAGVPLRTIFMLASIPAVIAVFVLLFGIQEKRKNELPATQPESKALSIFSSFAELKNLGHGFRRFLAANFIFTLGNSTDAFLLLRFSNVGLSPGKIAGLWSVHHVVKMTSSYYGGKLADRFGRRMLITSGWMLYAIIYAVFGLSSDKATLIAAFICYGFYFGLSEPAERALVADLVEAKIRGRAYGVLDLTVGLGALPASLLFGGLWQSFGAATAFGTSATLAAAAMIILFSIPASKLS